MMLYLDLCSLNCRTLNDYVVTILVDVVLDFSRFRRRDWCTKHFDSNYNNKGHLLLIIYFYNSLLKGNFLVLTVTYWY